MKYDRTQNEHVLKNTWPIRELCLQSGKVKGLISTSKGREANVKQNMFTADFL